MFFPGSKSRKVDLGGASRNAKPSAGLVQQLDEAREARAMERRLRDAAVRVQAIARQQAVRRALATEQRSLFDERIASALAAPQATEAQQLARALRFFYRPGLDSQRLVLLAALFRDPRLVGALPLTLLPVLAGALPVESGRGATSASFVALVRLLNTLLTGTVSSASVARAVRRCPQLVPWIAAALRECLAVPPVVQALLALALHVCTLDASARIAFTQHVLVLPQLLAAQSEATCARVAPLVELPTSETLSDAAALAMLGNVAHLVGLRLLEPAVVCAAGVLLRRCASTVLPTAPGADGDDSSDEDERDPVAAATVAAQQSVVLDHLHVLTEAATIHVLFAQVLANSARLTSLCVVYATLLEYWAPRADAIRSAVAFAVPESIRALWSALVGDVASRTAFETSAAAASTAQLPWMAALTVFCEAYGRLLQVQTDEDFFGGTLLSLDELGQLVQMLRLPVVRLYADGNTVLIHRYRFLVRLLTSLYERDCRRPFVPAGRWIASEIDSAAILREYEQARMSKATEALLRDVPFFLPFLRRVEILRRVVTNDGGWSHDEEHLRMAGMFPHGVRVEIRRDHIMEDGFAVFRQLLAEKRHKERLRITFIDQNGLQEPGVDGGGIYKEFLNVLVKQAFLPPSPPQPPAPGHRDPNHLALFLETETHKLYPNPANNALWFDEWYEFLGAVVGKAVYENQLVELPLAPFFVSKLLGKSNSLAHLASLDAELHRNLLYVLHYKGDWEHLGLNWSVTEVDPVTGKLEERDLVANGRHVPVTRDNHVHYVYAMANYKMNVSIKRQSKAFTAGFSLFIRPFVARLFNEAEMQMLISGEEGPLNLEDWQRNCTYSGGFHPSQPVIREFWDVVAEFSPTQQRQLLRFITSCSRPPLLGFAALFPVICIHQRDGGDEYLPTAATCMNLLKLPRYSNKYVMRERLLYAIESESGFGLS